MSTTAGQYLRKRRCGMGPSTQSATKRTRPGTGPRKGARGRYRTSGNTRLRSRRKTRQIRSFSALASKVLWNSQKLHGSLQRNQQATSWINESASDVRTKYPLLLDVTNFTSNNIAGAVPADSYRTIYKMVQSTVTPGIYASTPVGGFTRDNFVGLNNGGNTLWANMNADIPDTGKYFAVGSQYRLQFAITGSVRVRIQVFTVNTKMIGLDSKFRTFALPNAMDMMNRMCTGNQLPRKYFKVYKDFEKVFDPANNQTSGQPLVTFSFHHNKMCEQYLTNPAVGGSNPIDNLAPGTVSATTASGLHNTVGGFWFNYYNVPQGQPLWMLLSSDTIGEPGDPTPNKCDVSISRTVSWRDHVGAA